MTMRRAASLPVIPGSSRVMPRLSAADPRIRTEVIISLLRAAVAAEGAVALFILVYSSKGDGYLLPGAVALSAVALVSLISAVPLAHLHGDTAVRRAAVVVTAIDLLAVLAYSAYFAERPGAGSAYPAFVLILGPVRWGWRGVPITGIPIGLIAMLWPQQTLSGTTYNVGQIWLLVMLFAGSTAAIVSVSRRSNARLRQAQDQFQVAFEHASIGMALLDDLGVVVQANRSLSQLLGVAVDDLQSQPVSAYLVQEDGQQLRRTLALLSDSRPSARLEVQLERPDHEARWGLVAASWLAGGDRVPARVVLQVENITERKEAEVRMAYLADHDHLTGLPNRALLRRALSTGLEHGKGMGVLFLDLDRFKVINDGLGHAAGDNLLVAVAGRLAAVLRPGDLVARIGGDEFVMLCHGIHQADDLVRVGQRVLETIRPVVRLDGTGELAVTASVGAAVASTGASADTVLSDADTAMYAAKSSGGNRVELFSQALHQRALHSRELEVGLHRALQDDQLSLVYQPVVDLATGQVSSLEALARWTHPVWGEVGPSEFIPVAEQSDLIVSVGTWVLRRALEDAATWPVVKGTAAGVAVNVSPRQLSDGDFPGLVSDLLAETGVAGERLCLEITETALIGEVGPVVAVLRSLRELGVRLAIDDFGTGHASLSYLTQFPVDTVKIDRSFVAGVATEAGSAAIVGGVVAMAHAFGLRVVGEGAETAEQLSQLRRLGCEYAQGFVLARPLLAEAVPSALGLSARIEAQVPAPRRGEAAAGLDEALRYRVLLESARDISACLDLDSVLDRSFRALRKVIAFTGGSIQVVDGDVIRLAATDPPAPPEAMRATVPIGQGVGGAIAATGEPRYLPDVTIVASLSADGAAKTTSQGVRSYYGVPLVAEGRIIGVLQIDSHEIDAFDEQDRLLVLSFASVVASAVQTARLFSRELDTMKAPPTLGGTA